MISRVLGDRYQLETLLGAGGQAEVWRGLDRADERPCAIKWYLASEPLKLAARAEAAALDVLRLPGVVGLRATGEADGRPYAVLDLVEGGAPFPGAPTPVGWEDLAPLAERLLLVLSRVHALGVLHRDLKPGNVLVDPGGQVTLVDFGLAGAAPRGPSPREALAGTPPYVAPELLEGQRASARSDLFAVGVMLFQALTGASPWVHDGSSAGLEAAMRRRPPRRAEALGVALPLAAGDLLGALLATAPGGRPESAARALGQLERLRALAPEAPALGRLPERDPLSEADLAGLFSGPEPIFHIPSEAGAALWLRTGGRRAAVAEELRRWEMDGLLRRDGAYYQISRDALDRLAAGEGRRLAAPPAGEFPAALEPEQHDLLAWVGLSWPHATPDLLAEGMGLTREELDAWLLPLVEAGLVAIAGESVEDRSGGVALTRWGDLRRARAHARLAKHLPPGTPGRLRHLLAADDLLDALDEALLLAEGLWREGRLAELVGLLERALGWGAELDADRRRRLLERMVAAALASEIRPKIALARDAVRRADPAASALLALCDAALSIHGGDAAGAAERLATLDAFEDERLEVARQQIAVQTASFGPRPAQIALLDGLEARWVGRSRSRRARLLGWRGTVAYLEARYEASAALHLASAADREDECGRLAALLCAASAWLEADRWADAERSAAEAAALAWRIHNPAHEALALHLQRAAAYRSERPVDPAPALARAAMLLEDRVDGAMILITEAALGWRLGDTEGAVPLALAAERRFASEGHADGARLAMALADHIEPQLSDEARERLAQAAELSARPLLGLQTLGLLGPRLARPEEHLPAALRLAAALPEDRWQRRRELCSVDEALRGLRRDTFENTP